MEDFGPFRIHLITAIYYLEPLGNARYIPDFSVRSSKKFMWIGFVLGIVCSHAALLSSK